MDETIVNECDKWIIFGDTYSKGKKNDGLVLKFLGSIPKVFDPVPVP